MQLHNTIHTVIVSYTQNPQLFKPYFAYI